MTSQAVDALQKIHVQVEKVIGGMEQSDWELQSLCEGWRVQEVFAHMSSNMKEAVNPTPPPETPQEPMKAEEAMEALVAPRRDWTAQELLDEYEKYLEDWINWLSAIQEEPTASAEIQMADLGTYPLHMMSNAFAFDHYCHLYIDILAPEGSIEPTRLRSLIFANHDTQAVQMVSIADSGQVVVTLHQPQARPRSVTGFGLCEDVADEDMGAEAGE